MSDGKIYIIVTDQLPNGTTPTPETPGKTEKKDESKMLGHWARSKLLDEAKHLATTAVSFGVNNIGNFTGDFQAQRDVQNMISVLGDFASVGASIGAGFVVANVPGAIISGIISGVNMVVSKGQQYFLSELQRKRQNYEIDILRRRAGLNALIDGSRGTEN